MTLLTAITVGVLFATSAYLLLSRELKAVAMGVFLLGHGANLAMLSASGSPAGLRPPVLGAGGVATGNEADPLPQALILTAIVIGFAVQAFALTLIVITWRRTRTLQLNELAAPPAPVERLLESHDPNLLRLSEPEVPNESDPAYDPDTPPARGLDSRRFAEAATRDLDADHAYDPDHPAYDRRQLLAATDEHEELVPADGSKAAARRVPAQPVGGHSAAHAGSAAPGSTRKDPADEPTSRPRP